MNDVWIAAILLAIENKSTYRTYIRITTNLASFYYAAGSCSAEDADQTRGERIRGGIHNTTEGLCLVFLYSETTR